MPGPAKDLLLVLLLLLSAEEVGAGTVREWLDVVGFGLGERGVVRPERDQ